MPIEDDGTLIDNELAQGLNEDSAANAFLNLFGDDASKKKPSEDKGEEGEPEADEAEEDTQETEGEPEDAEEPSEDAEETEGEEDTDEDKPAAKKYADDNDTYVKIKVGEEEHEVPVKDLKRLFGQEKSLTQKSQEVAERTKKADEAQARSLAALDVLVKRAQEAANPYRSINWAALMKDPNVSAEDVHALQETAKAAFENETFLTGQLDTFMQQVQTQQRETQAAAAQACIKAITDEKSPTYIKGWDQPLYNELREFGVKMGIKTDIVNQLTDPGAFKILHMAMQFSKGQDKVVTTKVNKAPKKIVKSSTAAAPQNKATSQAVSRKEALAKMRRDGGSMKSAQNAFEALLGND